MLKNNYVVLVAREALLQDLDAEHGIGLEFLETAVFFRIALALPPLHGRPLLL